MTRKPDESSGRGRAFRRAGGALLLLGLGAWIFGEALCRLAPPDSPGEARLETGVPDRRPAARPELARQDASPVPKGVWIQEVRDRRTGELLEGLQLDLVDGRGRLLLPLRPPAVLPERYAGGSPGLAWRYEAPHEEGPQEVFFPLDEALPDDQGVLALPYRPVLEVLLLDAATGEALTRRTAFAATLADEEAVRRRWASSASLLPADILDSPVFFLEYARAEGLLQSELRALPDEEEEDGSLELVLPRGGRWWLQFWSRDHDPVLEPLEVPAAARLDLARSLTRRPLVHGFVHGADGEPAPGVAVELTADLAPWEQAVVPLVQDPGLFGMGVVYGASGVRRRTAKRTVWTDDAGHDALRVPRARRLAVFAFSREGSDLRVRDENTPLQEDWEVDLFLDPGPAGADLHLVRGDGTPLAGARVLAWVAVEDGFYRQLPEGRTDEDGSLRFPWRRPGERYGLAVFHPSWEGPKRVEIGAEETEVVIPGLPPR